MPTTGSKLVQKVHSLALTAIFGANQCQASFIRNQYGTGGQVWACSQHRWVGQKSGTPLLLTIMAWVGGFDD